MEKPKNHTVNRTSEQEQARIDYVVGNMKENKAYIFNRKENDEEQNSKQLNKLVERYISYRQDWKIQTEVYK